MIRAGSWTTTPHALEQRLAIEDRVRVDAAYVPVAGDVEARIQRVRLPAVLLVDDDEVRVRRAAVDRAHGLASGRRAGRTPRTARARTRRRSRSSVPSPEPSLTDDHLELRVVEPEERLDGRHDDRLLVVRGDDDAHRDREPRRRRASSKSWLASLVPADGVLHERDDDERDVDQVRQRAGSRGTRAR